MLLQIGERLEELIVRLLSGEGSASAAWLKARMAKEGKYYSIQGIYKELRKLQRAGVVTKVADRYSLSLTWIYDLVAFSEKLHVRHLEAPPTQAELPLEGQRLSWRFNGLKKLDDFTIQTVFLLYRQSKSKVLFEWTGHPWYQLLQYEKEKQLINAMKIAGNRVYMIVGGNGYLDTLYADIYPEDVFTISYAEGPFEEDRSKHLFLIDDYILTANLGKTAQEIDVFYDSAISAKDLDVRQALEIFQGRKKLTAVLEKKAVKARRLRRKFKDFFGLS